MIDIKEQKDFDFLTEKKPIVFASNMKNDDVKSIMNKLGINPEKHITEPFTTFYTLDKIASNKVHIVHYDKLKDEQEKIIKELSSFKEDVCVLIDSFENETYLDFVELLSEKIMTNNYQMTKFKTNDDTKDIDYYLYGVTEIYQNVKTGYVIGDAVNHCKDLVNTPYNYLNASDLANYAKTLEKYDNVKVSIYDKKQIEEMKMGSYLGVNKGSKDEPKLIFIEYKNSDETPTSLVGKGVMYDTGGYSLKTPTSMPGMKVDMAGAAAVISALEAIARLQLETSVNVVVAATDNRIGEDAIVPDDIITAANGKTIEIISTDAEGRLTLADAVWFAQQKGSKQIIDVATLTGAIVAALGSEFTGAFTNNQDFYNQFEKVTKQTKEHIWQMPISKGYHDELKSKVADMTNKGGRYAGASIAAAFIENFIDKDTKWIHLDIAGTSSKKGQGTGVMVKSFTKFFM